MRLCETHLTDHTHHISPKLTNQHYRQSDAGMLAALRPRRCWSIKSNKLQPPFHGNGSSTNPADSWKSLDRIGHRKSRALSRPVRLKASSYVKLHKGGLFFLIFSDIVFIGNQSRLETHMSFKDCGTSLWNHFGQLSKITKLPGAFFLGVCVVTSLPGCDEMHLKSFKNSDTFRILLDSWPVIWRHCDLTNVGI